MEAEHNGFEVLRVEGVARCKVCLTQIDLKLFRAVELKGFDEETWQDLYQDEYRGREKVEELE